MASKCERHGSLAIVNVGNRDNRSLPGLIVGHRSAGFADIRPVGQEGAATRGSGPRDALAMRLRISAGIGFNSVDASAVVWAGELKAGPRKLYSVRLCELISP